MGIPVQFMCGADTAPLYLWGHLCNSCGVLTLLLRVYGDTCAIHAQQIDHVSGLVLFLSVGNIVVTITSLDWNWGHKCGRVGLEKEIATGT